MNGAMRHGRSSSAAVPRCTCCAWPSSSACAALPKVRPASSSPA